MGANVNATANRRLIILSTNKFIIIIVIIIHIQIIAFVKCVVVAPNKFNTLFSCSGCTVLCLPILICGMHLSVLTTCYIQLDEFVLFCFGESAFAAWWLHKSVQGMFIRNNIDFSFEGSSALKSIVKSFYSPITNICPQQILNLLEFLVVVAVVLSRSKLFTIILFNKLRSSLTIGKMSIIGWLESISLVYCIYLSLSLWDSSKCK